MSSAAQMLGENEDSYPTHPNTKHRDCLWDIVDVTACSSAEKIKDSVTAEGRNDSNAGLSINPRGPALRNVMSHCGENQKRRPSETDMV